MEIKVKIDGLDDLLAAAKRAPKVAVGEISKAVQKSVGTVHSAALREAPVNRQQGGGTLRQMINQRFTSKLSGEIESRANYSVYVHEGTRPHEIRIRNKRVLANKRTGQIFGKRVMHPGTKANPFMERALKKSQGKVNGYFKKATENILKSFKAMHGI